MYKISCKPVIAIILFLFFGCEKDKNISPVEEDDSARIVFDLSARDRVIKNIFSSINVWDFRAYWVSQATGQPTNYFSNNYPFVKTVKFMMATGGNETRDLFVNPKDNTTLDDYKFDEIITALHNVVNQGLKPEIKTGNVPLKYSSNPILSKSFGVNLCPPDDYEIYYQYINTLAKTLVCEFGIDEVKTWSWGVYNEYENNFIFSVENNAELTKLAFFKLYDYTVAALQDAIGAGNLVVGAHSMTTNIGGLWDEGEFIDHVARGINYKTGEKGTQINFLAASFYDKQPGYLDSSVHLELPEAIISLRNRAIANGLANLKYGIDEGRILQGPPQDSRALNSRVVAHSFQGASDAKLFKIMNELDADWFSSWGVCTEGLWGGLPTVSSHIANLSYKMAGEICLKQTDNTSPSDLENEVNGLASYNELQNTVHVMVYNYNKNMESKSHETRILYIKNIKLALGSGSSVTIKQWLVDDNHGNFWPVWEADMKSMGITNDAFPKWSSYSAEVPRVISSSYRNFWYSKESLYKELAALRVTTTTETITNNTLKLQLDIAHHGVVFFEIENVKPAQ